MLRHILQTTQGPSFLIDFHSQPAPVPWVPRGSLGPCCSIVLPCVLVRWMPWPEFAWTFQVCQQPPCQRVPLPLQNPSLLWDMVQTWSSAQDWCIPRNSHPCHQICHEKPHLYSRPWCGCKYEDHQDPHVPSTVTTISAIMVLTKMKTLAQVNATIKNW